MVIYFRDCTDNYLRFPENSWWGGVAEVHSHPPGYVTAYVLRALLYFVIIIKSGALDRLHASRDPVVL